MWEDDCRIKDNTIIQRSVGLSQIIMTMVKELTRYMLRSKAIALSLPSLSCDKFKYVSRKKVKDSP